MPAPCRRQTGALSCARHSALAECQVRTPTRTGRGARDGPRRRFHGLPQLLAAQLAHQTQTGAPRDPSADLVTESDITHTTPEIGFKCSGHMLLRVPFWTANLCLRRRSPPWLSENTAICYRLRLTRAHLGSVG